MSRKAVVASILLGVLIFAENSLAEEKAEQVAKGWGTVVDPDKDCQVKVDGYQLSIVIPGTHHDLTHTDEGSKLNAPRVVRDDDGGFLAQVKVKKFPLPKTGSSSGKFSFTSCGIVIWQDDNNFIRLERAAEADSGGPFVWFERFRDGKSESQNLMRCTDADIQLRALRRKGDRLTFEWSEDGEEWTTIHEAEDDLPPKLKIGPLAINTTKDEFTAQVESVGTAEKLDR